MARKKEKSNEQIEEEISFMSSIKNTIPDYDYRIKEIYRLYNEAKDGKIQKVSWDTLVGSQGPGTVSISQSDWKRFVSLYRWYKKREKLEVVSKELPIEKEKAEVVTQLNLFSNTFNTSRF